MTATDELCRLLDERGVEYEVDDQGLVFYSVDGFGWVYVGIETHGQLMHQQLLITPEQAIAATLGDSEYERKMDALLCRLTNGKFSKTRAYDLDFMESVVREEFETDAAALEAGTCEADETETIACRCYGDPHGKAVYHIHVMECTECGHTYEHVNGDYEYCPRCGRKRRDVSE